MEQDSHAHLCMIQVKASREQRGDNQQIAGNNIMEKDYEEEINEILQKLHFKSIDDLLQADTLSIDKIQHRSRVHGIVVAQYLSRLHEIILKTQLLQKKILPSAIQQPIIELGLIYPGINYNIEEGEIIEILGRSNSGKTTLMINCMKQAIQKKVRPILLSSGDTHLQYLQQLPAESFMNFKFITLCDLAMLIHIIGNQILEKCSQTKYLLFIDCLSQIEQEEESVEFDSSEKFRRLINTFSSRTQTTIIYAYRVNNSLFPTQFKKDHHRPKCKNSKEWDGWTNKNLMIDCLMRKKDGRLIVRIIFPKSLDNRLYEVIL